MVGAHHEDLMLYPLHVLQRSLLAPFAAIAERTAAVLTDLTPWPLPLLRANRYVPINAR